MQVSTTAEGICYAVAARKVLLLGGFGQVGVAIRQSWDDEIVAPRHAELDICDAQAFAQALDAVKPDVAINCAAYHNVEQCEADPARAFEANAIAVNAMAEACAQRGVAFLTFSTDYVFDGELGRAYAEDDRTGPLNAYGVSKLAGELLVQRLQAPCYLVRTCGVYGFRESAGKGHTFVQRIITQARAGETVRVVNDQTVSPTFAGDLAWGVRRLLDSSAGPGLYHAVNDGPVTWYDYARAALDEANIEREIVPMSYKDWKTRVRRPAFSALQNRRFLSIGIQMPTWRDGLRKYIESAQF